MSDGRNLQSKQFGQLPMFMSAREITSQWRPGDSDPRATKGDDQSLWDVKARDARQSGLTESIRTQGVRDPITLDLNEQGGSSDAAVYSGHHRIAASMETDPDRLIPVLHHSDTETQDWSHFDRAYPTIDGTGSGDLEPDRWLEG